MSEKLDLTKPSTPEELQRMEAEKREQVKALKRFQEDAERIRKEEQQYSPVFDPKNGEPEKLPATSMPDRTEVVTRGRTIPLDSTKK